MSFREESAGFGACHHSAEGGSCEQEQQIQRTCAVRILTTISLALLLTTAAAAHERCPKAECEETKQQIRHIQAKMRQGYTRKQGEKMEQDLRKLRAIRSKKCR
jgi:hypothetical protein